MRDLKRLTKKRGNPTGFLENVQTTMNDDKRPIKSYRSCSHISKAIIML